MLDTTYGVEHFILLIFLNMCGSVRKDFQFDNPPQNLWLTESEGAMANEKVPMTKRRMEEIALVFLKFLLNPKTDDGQSFENEGVTEDEFFELLWLVAPEKIAELEAEADATWIPYEHMNEILHGASLRMQEDALRNLGIRVNTVCIEPVCKVGCLEKNGSGKWECSICHREFDLD